MRLLYSSLDERMLHVPSQHLQMYQILKVVQIGFGSVRLYAIIGTQKMTFIVPGEMMFAKGQKSPVQQADREENLSLQVNNGFIMDEHIWY